MRATRIFISYRRDDAAGYARAVYDELARRFGADLVFIDVDDINAGQPFGEAIRRAMGASEVLLVLIGKRWRGEREGMPARIDEADDPVRAEVAAGLSKGMRVIPLLLDGAAMPNAGQLPEALRALAQRNALEIGNTRFAADIERLLTALRETLDEAAPARPVRNRRWLLPAAVLVAGAALGAWYLRAAPERSATSTVQTPSTARPAIDGRWQAEVDYDWPNAHYTERFVFAGEGSELHGSASFLGVARGLLEGSVAPDGLRFVTRTREDNADTVHRYRARLVGDELRFMMQTEGGSSAHVPVEFIARRSAP